MKSSFIFHLTTLLAGICLSAAAKDETARKVRFLALGELPPFQQEIRDNVRYELEPPAGSIPPREVMLGFGDDQSQPTPLRLGQITAPLKAPSGAGPLLLAMRGDAKDAEPWLRLTRPETGDFLVLLWRDSKQGSWQKVKSLVVPDDAVAAPSGSVRYVNISPATVDIGFGGDPIALIPGGIYKRTLPVGVEHPFEIFLPDTSGAKKRLHSGVVLQNPGERSLVLIYFADGVGHRRPLKVTVQREQAPVKPPKK
ncbi:MAG: hypothetical protein V4819_16185 [Verrucomicrobiota bacterium]